MSPLTPLINWLYGVNWPPQLTEGVGKELPPPEPKPQPLPEGRCICGCPRTDHDNDGWCSGCTCSYHEELSGHWLTPVWPKESSTNEGVAA